MIANYLVKQMIIFFYSITNNNKLHSITKTTKEKPPQKSS